MKIFYYRKIIYLYFYLYFIYFAFGNLSKSLYHIYNSYKKLLLEWNHEIRKNNLIFKYFWFKLGILRLKFKAF
jgi:hypothetical protein